MDGMETVEGTQVQTSPADVTSLHFHNGLPQFWQMGGFGVMYVTEPPVLVILITPSPTPT